MYYNNDTPVTYCVLALVYTLKMSIMYGHNLMIRHSILKCSAYTRVLHDFGKGMTVSWH